MCYASAPVTARNATQLEMNWRDDAPSRPTRGIDLRALQEALGALGQGFLEHPRNDELRRAVTTDALPLDEYLRQLVRLSCQLLFVLTLEARALLHPRRTAATAKKHYLAHYALLRWLERGGATHLDDRWTATQRILRGLGHGDEELGLPALGGLFAFADPLGRCALDDDALGRALRALRDGARKPLSTLAPEDLGSVYESALAFGASRDAHGALALSLAKHSARRTTGSYYTPDSLVQTILEGALDPLLASAKGPRALQNLTVVDPACGTGHFLLAAARRLAAAIDANAPNPTPTDAPSRATLRKVLRQCVFGVDVDPLAVALCRMCLWLEAAEPGLPLAVFDASIQHGNALFGATLEQLRGGIPDAAWNHEDKATSRRLRKRNREERHNSSFDALKIESKNILYDAWCCSFVWPIEMANLAPTHAIWSALGERDATDPTVQTVHELSARHRLFHWTLRFPQVFAAGGFDAVIGNPPWIAHAGRAAQPLPAGVKRFYEWSYPAFADYPTTHGLFASLAPTWLRDGGMLGLVLPSSLSELGGYAPTRLAHDRLCEFPAELTDFGEGRFEGVTQPCMALISRRAASGRRDAAPGSPWPVARPDLSVLDRDLLQRLSALPSVPSELFGERGVQSDKSLQVHFVKSSIPTGRFTTPIREGSDVREYELLAPRIHVDRHALGERMRDDAAFAKVAVLIRQTARYPIAARSDGLAFRNSLLAAFSAEGWPADALLALLNSALVRWMHYQRFRDARQPVMPQVKIAHLRAIPAPPGGSIAPLARRSRDEVDERVAALYELSSAERDAVHAWHRSMRPRHEP